MLENSYVGNSLKYLIYINLYLQKVYVPALLQDLKVTSLVLNNVSFRLFRASQKTRT